ALDGHRGPLPRARLVRSGLEAGDDSRIRESARLVDLDRGARARPRDPRRRLADAGRAPRARLRGRRRARAGRMTIQALALTGLLAAALPAHGVLAAPTQQEVEESLTCQCGCGLTVHSCNH